MATNVFLTDDIITLEGLSILENELGCKAITDRKYEALFGAHGGSNRSDTIRIRKPNQYAVRSGRTFTPGNIEDQYTDMVVDTQIGVDTEIYSDEFKQDLSSFSDQVIKPQMVLLANAVDTAVLAAAKQTHNVVGTPGTVPTDLRTYLQAGAALDRNSAPRDGQRSALIGPEMQLEIVDGLKGLYNSQGKIADQFDSGEVSSKAAGLKFAMDQNLASHTVGPQGGSPLVKTLPTTGDSALVTKGWTASAASRLVVNDVFTVANVYGVNLVSKVSTGKLQQFRVTAAFSSDGAGDGSVSVYPPMYSSGPKQTITALPQVNAVISVLGAANTVSAQGIVAHKSAIALAFCPLPKPEGVDTASSKTDKKLGISMRFVRWFDGDTDLWKARFDVKYGIKVLRPEWVCRVASGAA